MPSRPAIHTVKEEGTRQKTRDRCLHAQQGGGTKAIQQKLGKRTLVKNKEKMWKTIKQGGESSETGGKKWEICGRNSDTGGKNGEKGGQNRETGGMKREHGGKTRIQCEKR